MRLIPILVKASLNRTLAKLLLSIRILLVTKFAIYMVTIRASSRDG